MSSSALRCILAACLTVFLPFVSETGYPQAPENSSALYHKGAALAKNGAVDQSIPLFRRVIELSPSYCLGHYGLGKAYLSSPGMLGDAIKHLRLCVRYDQRFAKGYFYLGMAYLFAKQYVPALHAFKSAYDYDETMLEALYNIFIIYDMMGQGFKAMVYYNKYLEEKTRSVDDMPF